MNKGQLCAILFVALTMACSITTPPATPTASALPSSATPSRTASPTQWAPLNGCLNAAGPVRLREEPSTEADIITRIPPASCFSVYGYNAEHTWVWIGFQGNYGWAAAQYVSIEGEASKLPVLAPGVDTSRFATLTTTSTVAGASGPAPTATRTVRPSPTATPTQTASPTPTPTALAIPSPVTLLCSDTSSYRSRKVTCEIPLAYCSYSPAIAGSPTYCTDAPYPRNKFTLLVWGQDWSDYDGKCMVITGLVRIYQNKPQIEATSRSQISYCP